MDWLTTVLRKRESPSSNHTGVPFMLLGFRVVACFHEGHPIGHHPAPHALCLGRPLAITFSDGLYKTIEPQVIQRGWNVEVALTMQDGEALEVGCADGIT